MNTDDVLRGRLDLAQRQLDLGQVVGAIETLRGVLSMDPDHADAHALLAIALVVEKRLHAAEHEAGMALALEPESPLPQLAAGQVALAQRRFDRALEHFETLRALWPEGAQPLLSLASVHDLRGDRVETRRLLDEALAKEPDDPEVWARLGHWHLEGNAIDEAERCALRAMELGPGDVDAVLLAGHVALYRDRLDEAREHAIWVLREAGGHEGALRLITQVKARGSLVLGLWWRWNTWMIGLGEGRAIAVLLGAYVVYRFASIAAENAGYGHFSELIEVFWLGIVLYTWLAPALFRNLLNRELGSVELRDF